MAQARNILATRWSWKELEQRQRYNINVVIFTISTLQVEWLVNDETISFKEILFNTSTHLVGMKMLIEMFYHKLLYKEVDFCVY